METCRPSVYGPTKFGFGTDIDGQAHFTSLIFQMILARMTIQGTVSYYPKQVPDRPPASTSPASCSVPAGPCSSPHSHVGCPLPHDQAELTLLLAALAPWAHCRFTLVLPWRKPRAFTLRDPCPCTHAPAQPFQHEYSCAAATFCPHSPVTSSFWLSTFCYLIPLDPNFIVGWWIFFYII